MEEWLECALAVLEVSGSIPGRGGTEIFADIGYFLTTLVSPGLSKYNGFVHLKQTIQNQEQHYQHSLQTLCNLELDLDPLPSK